MKLSLFSVSYAGFWGQSTLSLVDFIKQAGRLGFPSVMIAGKRPHLSPLDATPELLKPVQAALTVSRVRCDIVIGAVSVRRSPSCHRIGVRLNA